MLRFRSPVPDQLDLDSVLSAWTLVHIEAYVHVYSPSLVANWSRELLDWETESLLTSCQNLPFPDSNYLRLHYDSKALKLFDLRTKRSLWIANNHFYIHNSPPCPIITPGIGSLIDLTSQVRIAMPQLRKRQYDNSNEVDYMARLATKQMEAYLVAVQQLQAPERRIRFAK